MIKTDEELYEFCKDHYYCDADNGIRMKWGPFEDWSDEDIEGCIHNDVISLKIFFGREARNGEDNNTSALL